MFKKIYNYFDKLEDKVRGRLSHYPIIYSIIGGTLIVLFWRAVWHTADILEAKGGLWAVIFNEPISIVWTIAGMLLIGLFVSFFVGDVIIISGMKREKKVVDKTEEEIRSEADRLVQIQELIKKVRLEMDRIDTVCHHKLDK